MKGRLGFVLGLALGMGLFGVSAATVSKADPKSESDGDSLQRLHSVVEQSERGIRIAGDLEAANEELEVGIRAWEDEIKQSCGDDTELAKFDLEGTLQKQKRLTQMMSNISKMIHDTVIAVIRKT